VVKLIEYDSFGNVITDSDPTINVPFGFAGGLHDRDTGLVRFGYRDYDPDTGRWTAKDPIFFAGGDTDLYGYVLNNPVNFIDPLGLFGERGWFGTRPTGEDPTTGRQGSDSFFVGAEGQVMNTLDNFVPGFHSYSSLFHDPLVDGMINSGFNEELINIPSLILSLPAVPAFAIMDTIADFFIPDDQGCP
jgi:RHS repeat-associated protein